MRVVVEPTPEAACERAAEQVARTLRAHPTRVLGVATGRTMRPLYAALARRHREEGLSLARVRAFALDEFLGLGRDDPGSFRAYLERHLVAATDLPAAALHVPDGRAPDPWAEAERTEEAIRAAGGIDLQLLGIGLNGHLGFNEPGSALLGRSHVAVLAEETVAAAREAEPGAGGRGGEGGPSEAALAASGGDAPPEAGITLGLGTILAARSCLLLATGPAKAAAVAAAVEGPLTASVPASVLQLHPDATVIVDAAAGAALERAEAWRRARRLGGRPEGRTD